jgi:hypothetical protein
LVGSGAARFTRSPRRISRFLAEARVGWIDARLMVAMPGRERALRFVAVLLFGQRASYVVPALAGMTARPSATTARRST